MRLYDYPASGNCLKVRILLALLGEPYERVEVDIFAGGTLTPAFGRLNPLRETPVLELDDDTPLVQSAAILWFLAEETPYLPPDRLGRAQVVSWLVFEQERLMPGVGGTRFRTLTGRPLPGGRRELGEEALDHLDQHLAGRSWVVGEAASIADVALYGYTHVAGDGGFDLARRPRIQAWLARVESLPGFVNDLAPYGDNARPGAGRSTYDAPAG